METHRVSKEIIISETDRQFPTTVIIPNQNKVTISSSQTAYGIVSQNGGKIIVGERVFNLYEGIYFSVPGEAIIQEMVGLLCVRESYRGIFSFGGPVEERGRLNYIDGCSDTVLVSPLIFGDPCLNYIHAPSGINQRMHTHPSVRVGYVLEGKGHMELETEKLNLEPGTVFIIPPEEIHSMHTEENFLKIIVFHPDSDFGPTDTNHPMINRTYVNGKSLKVLK